jgi:hypothetical protein
MFPPSRKIIRKPIKEVTALFPENELGETEYGEVAKDCGRIEKREARLWNDVSWFAGLKGRAEDFWLHPLQPDNQIHLESTEKYEKQKRVRPATGV